MEALKHRPFPPPVFHKNNFWLQIYRRAVAPLPAVKAGTSLRLCKDCSSPKKAKRSFNAFFLKKASNPLLRRGTVSRHPCGQAKDLSSLSNGFGQLSEFMMELNNLHASSLFSASAMTMTPTGSFDLSHVVVFRYGLSSKDTRTEEKGHEAA